MVDDHRYYPHREDDRSHRDRDYYSGDAARDYGTCRSSGYGNEQHDRNFRGGGTGYGDRSRYASSGDRQQGHGGRQAQGTATGDRRPEGYRYEERGFIDRAGDEVRSWFGDDEAERRREYDQRYDERHHGGTQSYGRQAQGGGSREQHSHDADYHHWRQQQISQLDRDYDEYRRENRAKFQTEFGGWRSERETQRGSLGRVAEHMEVVGSDGAHVGTVDKVRGDRIVLTRTDPDAGGRHHSIPSRWIDRVDDKVVIRKSADEAKSHWRDEERSGSHDDHDDGGRVNLDRSFRGTY